MTKAIFLDFDGVLHPSTSIQGMNGRVDAQSAKERNLFRWAYLLEDAINKAPQAVRDNLMIGVHSSWRQLRNLDQGLLRNLLGGLAPYYIGMTSPYLARWESIEEMAQRAGIEDFIVIDDAFNEFPSDLRNLISCSPLEGISQEGVMAHVSEWLHNTPVERCVTMSAR